MKARHVIGFAVAALGAALTVTAGLHMADIGAAASNFLASGYIACMGFMTFGLGILVIGGDGTDV